MRIAAIAAVLAGFVVIAQGADPTTRPITTVKSEAGDLLRLWWAEGTAAGNAGDYYDNRDREHSGLNVATWPQLSKVAYTPEQLAARADWAAQHTLLPHVTFGNSSTSAGLLDGGSNVRRYYSNPRGLAFLAVQYFRNNLYIYPEHRDHDPGHNGPDGYGDVYPTNTPYLICTQGSSGSDQPFMKAMPHVLAAFRPEVKQKLVQSGALMPVVQAIFRSSNKHLTAPGDYLTGKAHPTAFEGAWVDELRMVKMAHALKLDSLPPVAAMKVVEEDRGVPGRDFFDIHADERLADTPCCIARIWRSSAHRRSITVSAEPNADINRKPLTYRWVVLRGDEKLVEIKPANESGSIAKITVAWHGRRPVLPGAALESNRVDIGLFVHNGQHFSPPAFVTFFCLDSEARTYDDAGRIVEIGYGSGASTFSIQWGELFKAMREDRDGVDFLKRGWTAPKLEAIAAAGTEFDAAHAAVVAAEQNKKEAKGDAVKPADQALTAAKKAEEEVLTKRREALGGSVKSAVEPAVAALAADPAFYSANAAAIDRLAAAAKYDLAGQKRRLQSYGLLAAGNGFDLTPLRPGSLTKFEACLLQRFHAELLAGTVLPGAVRTSYRACYVDPNLSPPKDWRDVYRYDDKGALTGWKRFYPGQPAMDFAPDGRVILEMNAEQKPSKLRAVRYEQPPRTSGQGPNWTPLRQTWAD